MTSAPDLVASTHPRSGERLLGRYRIERRIGTGGMGQVYLAHDERLVRDVAIKLFPTDGDGPGGDPRTVSEARALAPLAHPSLVTLFDAHLTSTPSFLVMEYIEGPTLRDSLLSGPVSLEDVACIAADLADALDTVHRAGIVHRDVKPANIILRPTLDTARPFETVLADFGIALSAGQPDQAEPGTVVGTAAYLAPEQLRGGPAIAASDVYALGLTLIEAITGRHPFIGSSIEDTILARLTRQPEIPALVGYAWKSLLTAMTASEPSARPTADDVRRRLDRLGDAPAETIEVLTAAADPADELPATLEQFSVTPEAPSTRRPARRPDSRPIALAIGLIATIAILAGAIVFLVVVLSAPTVLAGDALGDARTGIAAATAWPFV